MVNDPNPHADARKAKGDDVPVEPTPGEQKLSDTVARQRKSRFVSAGVANDVELYGQTIDPVSGDTVRAGDLKRK